MRIQSLQESDPRTFRKTLGHFASGVTVITTVHEGRVHGMTATAFCAVSFEPPLVLVCVENRRHMHRLLRQSGGYGVSILSQDQEGLSRHFAGQSLEGLQVPYVWHQGCPLIAGAVAHLMCTVIEAHPAGDHTLYLGQVEHLSSSDEGAPLLFYRSKYHTLEEHIWDLLVAPKNKACSQPSSLQRRTAIDKERIFHLLEQEASEAENPPLSLKEVGLRLGYQPTTLYKINRVACHTIAERHTAYRHKLREKRLQGYREEIRQIALFLQAEKVALTQRHIGRYLAQPAMLRDPKVRELLREVCREVEKRCER